MVSSRVKRLADAVASVAVVAWVAVDLLGTTVFGRVPWPDSIVDYRILYESSRRVVETKMYPAGYPYPPSAVVLQYATAQFSFPVSAALWMLLTGAAAVACWWTLARLLELERRPGATSLVVVAYAASASFFQWDLRSQNSNLVFLAALLVGVLALRAERPTAAGFWLALSFSLKLFSVLVIPYLAWTRRRTACSWAVIFVAIFWVALPAALLGVEGVRVVYAGWFSQLATLWRNGPATPILISLTGSVAQVTDREIGRLLIVNAIRIGWLVVALTPWFRPLGRATGSNAAFVTLSDVGALVLAPIALSPYLEPYHAVAFAIPALLLVVTAADRERSPGLRLAAVALVGATFVLPLVWPSFRVRGLVVNVQLLTVTSAALVFARTRAITS